MKAWRKPYFAEKLYFHEWWFHSSLQHNVYMGHTFIQWNAAVMQYAKRGGLCILLTDEHSENCVLLEKTFLVVDETKYVFESLCKWQCLFIACPMHSFDTYRILRIIFGSYITTRLAQLCSFENAIIIFWLFLA